MARKAESAAGRRRGVPPWSVVCLIVLAYNILLLIRTGPGSYPQTVFITITEG